MSAIQGALKNVYRLVDMVVEEVSLVDRAANKQRFLIVKRSDDMAKAADKGGKTAPPKAPKGKPPKGKTPPEGEEPTDPTDDEDDAEGEGEGTTPPPKKPNPFAKKPAKKSDDGSLLAAALSALEGLTEAVELLATTSEEQAGPELAELAEELDELADRIAAAAGAPPPDEDEEEEPADAAGAVSAGKSLRAAIASVRDTMKRVEALVASAGRAAPGGGAPAAPVNKADNASPERDAELKSLRETVQEQQQRLVALEKGVGLPNSAASDERAPGAASAASEDDGWPLDMNRPRDRTSVDKATSFHENA